MSVEVIHQCLLFHGHYGYTEELPFEQRLRDVLGPRRVRHSLSRRVLHHVGLFVGFLVVTSAALLFVRAVRNAIAGWF